MTVRKIVVCGFTLFAAAAFGQTVPTAGPKVEPTTTSPAVPVTEPTVPVTIPTEPATLPTYVGVGTTFNQIGSPRWDIQAFALYPTGVPVVAYTSTTLNILPKVSVTATGAKFYTAQTSLQQSLHKIVYQGARAVFLVGGGVGAAFSSASPSGTSVSIAASFTGTLGYKLSSRWGIIFPIQGIYTPAGLDLVPGAAVVFKPGKL